MRRRLAIIYFALLWTVALRSALILWTPPYPAAWCYREAFLIRVTYGDWLSQRFLPLMDDTDQMASPAGVPW